MKQFYLYRIEDETGVSGTGKVAEGVIFDSGEAVMKWLTETSSIAFYKSIEDVVKIHGHGGKTSVIVKGFVELNSKNTFYQKSFINKKISLELAQELKSPGQVKLISIDEKIEED